MKIAVRYYSRSGNTKKVAERIGKTLGVPAEAVSVPLAEPVDLLFLGGALYAANINKNLREFAESLTSEKVKRVAVFSTTAREDFVADRLKEILVPKGIIVEDRSFNCQGKFLFICKGHPDETDLKNAAAFADSFK